MTYQQSDFALPAELLEQIAEQGFDALPELIRTVINEAMRMERQNYLGVAPYQRSPERRGQANGFKPKTERTRLGEIEFAVPQVREGGFYPQDLEKGLRSERAWTLALAVFAFPAAHQRRLRTSNGLERLNRALDRRTTVVSIFPNEAACLRLVTAILVECDKQWQTDKIYLSLQASDTATQWWNLKEPKGHQRFYRNRLALSRLWARRRDNHDLVDPCRHR